MNKTEFTNYFWTQYLLLEQDFLDTERYVSINELNDNVFSSEYASLLLSICSEIDVVAKEYCLLFDSDKKKNIVGYRSVIMDAKPFFPKEKISFNHIGIKGSLYPWQEWMIGAIPIWWKAYNAVKHDRCGVNEYGLPNFTLANLSNVKQALAGLFQLELYFYKDLTLNKDELDIPTKQSKLFEIKNWTKFQNMEYYFTS